MPGEAIVKLKSSTIRAQSKLSSSAWVAKSLPGATHKRGGVDQELLVSLPPQASNATPLRKSSRAASENEPQNGTDDLRQRKLATLLQVKDLAKLPNVHDASANRILEAQGIPTDPLFSHQRWNFELANLPAAWDITTGSSDVTIAIVDSGAVRNHPDLESQFVDGYDVVDRDPDFADTHPNHGTHVAGIVGAIANNANGGAGVAWGSRLMPVRVLDEIGGSLYDVLQGVRYAAGLPNDLGVSPSRPADIINLSLGIALECSVAEAELFEQVLAAGIHLVAAAGNYQTNSAFAPAACPGVIGVASVGPGGERAPYSNFGARVDLAAPGGDIRFDRDTDGMLDGVLSTGATLLGEHTYVSMQGTSMAAPHVSGILALMKSINPTLSPLQVQQLIETGLLTDDVGEPGPDELGYGNINALKALRAAAGEFEVPASIRLLPGVLNFRNFDTELTFSVTNAGLAPLTVNQVRSMSANVAVEPLVVNAFGLGSYRAIALRDELELGTTHNGVIEVHSNIGVRELPVLVNHSIFNSSSRPGRLYLVVTEAASGEVVSAMPVDDRYKFLIDDLLPGDYEIFAGTDMNNDGNICDAGELCGAFGGLSAPSIVHYADISDAIDVVIEVGASAEA